MLVFPGQSLSTISKLMLVGMNCRGWDSHAGSFLQQYQWAKASLAIPALPTAILMTLAGRLPPDSAIDRHQLDLPEKSSVSCMVELSEHPYNPCKSTGEGVPLNFLISG